ncbi:MAG TPA: ATP-binding cassette domain-containing protein [Galbitalea sp.]|nr:ATP-binding cassette domain-containing protein [Galbitalea sp.]
MSIAALRSVDVRIGSLPVLRSVDLELRPGVITGLIGHNGAGKSTLLRTLAGLINPRAGSIEYDRDKVSARRNRVPAGLAFVPQGRGIFGYLSVFENLELGLNAGAGVRLNSEEGRQRLATVIEYVPMLAQFLERRTGELSGGQQSLVAISRALLLQPHVILLDEPSTGLAPVIVDQIMNLVERVTREESTSVLLVEQNIPYVMKTVDDVYVLKNGAIVAHDAPTAFTDVDALMSLF